MNFNGRDDVSVLKTQGVMCVVESVFFFLITLFDIDDQTEKKKIII